jgi:hypothetical protein
MAKKLAKAQFGREVTKSSYKVPKSDGSYKRVNSKVVSNKEGDITKVKTRTTTYGPTGEREGKLSSYENRGTTVRKQKYSPDSNKPTSTRTRVGIIPAKKTGGSIKKKK